MLENTRRLSRPDSTDLADLLEESADPKRKLPAKK
jgi:hypothetical protein